jgi:hypothetical protein
MKASTIQTKKAGYIKNELFGLIRYFDVFETRGS